MDKDYSQMNMDELDQAKYALEKQRAKLKGQMRKADEGERESFHQKIKTIRADMLLIQSWQDKLLSPPPRKPGTPFAISLQGLPSQAKIMFEAKRRKK